MTKLSERPKDVPTIVIPAKVLAIGCAASILVFYLFLFWKLVGFSN